MHSHRIELPHTHGSYDRTPPDHMTDGGSVIVKASVTTWLFSKIKNFISRKLDSNLLYNFIVWCHFIIFLHPGFDSISWIQFILFICWFIWWIQFIILDLRIPDAHFKSQVREFAANILRFDFSGRDFSVWLLDFDFILPDLELFYFCIWFCRPGILDFDFILPTWNCFKRWRWGNPFCTIWGYQTDFFSRTLIHRGFKIIDHKFSDLRIVLEPSYAWHCEIINWIHQMNQQIKRINWIQLMQSKPGWKKIIKWDHRFARLG